MMLQTAPDPQQDGPWKKYQTQTAPSRRAPVFVPGVKPVDPLDERYQRGQIAAQETAARAAEQEAQLREARLRDAEQKQRQLAASGGVDAGVEQSKAAGFYNRARQSAQMYEQTGVGPRGYLEQQAANVAPQLMNNVWDDPKRQVSEAAMRDFVAATLRYESGAAIPPEELESQKKIFFPAPGDAPETIAAKTKLRANAIESLRIGAGPAAALATPQEQRGLNADGRPAMLGDEQLLRGDQEAPIIGGRYTPEEEAQIQKAFADGDAGQALALSRRFGVKSGISLDPAFIQDAIEYVRKHPGTVIPINYAPTDRSAEAAAEREKFGDHLQPEMERQKAQGALGSAVGSFLGGVAKDVPFLDEIAAAGDTLGGGTYADNLRRVRAGLEAGARVNPVSHFGGQLAGAALPVGRALGFGRGVAATRSALSVGREGALLGGLYAAGDADPNPDASAGQQLASRVEAAPVGALVGGATAFGLGALGNRLRRSGSGPNPPPTGRETMAAADRQGIKLLPADVGGPVTRGTTAVARQGLLSEAPITRSAERAARQAGTARDAAAARAGTALDKDSAGEVIRRGAEVFSKQTSKTGEVLYNRAYKAAGDTRVTPAKALKQLDEHIAELSETPGGSGLLTELKAMRSELASGSFTVRGLRNMRTRLREEADFKGLRGSDTQRRLKDVLSAVAEDTVETLIQDGNPSAAKSFRVADAFWRKRVDTIDDVLEPLLGKRSPRSGEHILSTLERMADKETGDYARLRRVIGAMPDEEARSIRATVIQRLGQPKPGQQVDADQTFSFGSFLTRWNTMSDKAKSVLFPRESIDALNDLATVSRGARASNAYSNSSNTARSMMGQMVISGTLGGALDLATAGKAAAGQYLLGKLLASSHFARLLARSPRLEPKAIVRGLETVARRDPAIAQDALGLQTYLRQAMEQTPLRAAASGKDEKK